MNMETTLIPNQLGGKTQKKTNVHPLIFTSLEQLYSAYMPFIKHGGLFVRTTQNYHLGEEVFLLVQLPDEKQKHSIAGKVVWTTPIAAQGGKATGIGVQLTEKEGDAVSKHIQKLLAGHLKSDTMTDTM